MIGIYFSGTGNTKYCIEKFIYEYDPGAEAVSIEEETVIQKLNAHSEIIIGYPVQFSNIPKILKDFVDSHPNVWNRKKIFVIATMGLFSGDGAGMLARLLTGYGAVITGGLHLKMPDSIGDERALKRTLAQNRGLVSKAEQKIEEAVQDLKKGCPPQDGLRFYNRLGGLFGQRLYFYNKTKNYSSQLKIEIGRASCRERV